MKKLPWNLRRRRLKWATKRPFYKFRKYYSKKKFKYILWKLNRKQ